MVYRGADISIETILARDLSRLERDGRWHLEGAATLRQQRSGPPPGPCAVAASVATARKDRLSTLSKFTCEARFTRARTPCTVSAGACLLLLSLTQHQAECLPCDALRGLRCAQPSSYQTDARAAAAQRALCRRARCSVLTCADGATTAVVLLLQVSIDSTRSTRG